MLLWNRQGESNLSEKKAKRGHVRWVMDRVEGRVRVWRMLLM
ncbi:hypothetical protein E2C01_052594 [Portunus trituberculatus]|uniref:Uncharacterized protein n=1 Tax=Portunus trituberculatus TaxID=210409 RepID=A0A5B7GNN6_PORTR|nr:hypothetical protein [Portunus trituberculatus]